MIPTLNRPQLAKIAVDSVLAQDVEFQIDVILSNNGANPETRAIFQAEDYSGKVKYLEHEEIVPMTRHWELVTSLATGEYLMVLPDRKLLKQGALGQLVAALDYNEDCSACCCSDEEWSHASGRLVSNQSFPADIKLSTASIARDFERGAIDRNCLPLALNCLLRTEFVVAYRQRHGVYFDAISPDFRSAFNFLAVAQQVYVLASPLMIATGFATSNGGKAYLGDRSYSDSLGSSGRHRHMPELLQGNVWASIFEDYLRTQHYFTRDGDYKKNNVEVHHAVPDE